MKHLTRIAALAVAMTLGTTAHAQAVDQFTFTDGATTYTWEEAASPTVLNWTSSYFVVAAGVGAPGAELAFSTTVNGGGGGDGGFTVSGGVDFSSDQLFSGSTDSPTFLLGIFKGHDGSNLRPETLTISAVSAVPEAGNAAMLLSGVGLMGLIARRRKAVR